MLPKLSLLCVPWVVWAISAPSVRAEQPFLERYALAADRAAVLKDLVPGTEDYYFYHALYHQTQGQPEKAAALLAEWEDKTPGENDRRDLLKNRAALLKYDKDPAATLAWLKEKLELDFAHQRETEEARAELSATLDPALISPAAFEKNSLAKDLENLTDTGLYRLTRPVEKLELSEIRALLKRITRPDFPRLVEIVDRELKEKDAKFGAFEIHHRLSSEQLAQLQKRRPALLNVEAFTAAVMTRMRPTEFEDAARDPAVRSAWLERLWAYASTLPPKANKLRAHLLYHLLAHDEKQGRLDAPRLLAYLKIPRLAAYVNPAWQKDEKMWRSPAELDFDPSAYTGMPPVGNDEPLVRRLVLRYLATADNTDAIAPLVSDAWLHSVLAEAKLLGGAPEPQRWVSLLTPDAYQALRDRTDVEFDPASRQTWSPDDVVTLDVWLKNVPTLLVRVYEINTANVHRTGEEVNTGLDLDGLTANREQKFDYQEAPIRRTRQTFSFPELNGKRGVWIVEFVGNGRASRALIRKGGLRPIVRQTSAGTAVTVLDEKLKPVPKAFAMVGPKQFTADEKGLILLPLSTQPGPQKIILDDGTGFTALETIELQGESYKLEAGFHVTRESLLPGATATLLIRPRLESNGRPVLLESLEKVKVTVSSLTLDDTPASVVIPLEKLAEDQEATVEFAVPDRLKSLAFAITGEVRSAITGAPVQLSFSSQQKGSLEVNTITTSGQVSDLFLSRSGKNWVLQELGLNGEPRPGREVTVSFYRPEFTKEIEVLMKTDASGSIALGELAGVSSIYATDGVSRSFDLKADRSSMPSLIHLKAGESLTVPWPEEKLADAAEVSLIERRGEAMARVVPLPDKVTAGYLVWKALPAGTYTLFTKDGEKTVRVSPGEVSNGYALTATSTVQLTGFRPLTVSGLMEGEAQLPDGKNGLVYFLHVGNATPTTRVHVLTSRFLTTNVQYEFDAMERLGFSQGAEPAAVHPSWAPSQYLSARDIGDEYRYVLERRTAARFAGNMLSRPGLLINPWEIGQTETGKEKLEKGAKAQFSLEPSPADPFAAPKDAPAEPPVEGAFPVTPTTPPDPPSDLSFLATPAPALYNLRPNAQGDIVIPRAALGDRQYVRVLAIDRESSAVRDSSLSAAALPPRDLRLARQLNPAKHFSRQNIVSVLEKDAAFRFDDALAAQFQAIGHLGAVKDLFFNLTQNPQLNEFSWLLEWPTFDEAKKHALYSQYACHELHFFLHRKDRPFFDAVVKPYLASKRERTFMDDYLLEADVTRYLQPWYYNGLNALERILLAERIKNDLPVMRRQSEDWINNQPVNRVRDQFLFETALRGRALVMGQGLAEGMVAANGRGEDFINNYGAQPLDVNGTTTANLRGFYRSKEPTGTPTEDGRTKESGYSSIVEQEYISRRERVRGAYELEREGDSLYAKADYAGAIDRTRNALATMPNSLQNQADRQRIISKFSKAAVLHARELGHRGEFEKSKSLLNEVLSDEMSPNYKDAQVLLNNLDDPDRFNAATTPQHYANTEEVKRLFNKGLGYYDLGQFNEAEVEFNRILGIDPYNTAARRQLERTQREVTNYLKSGRDETRLRMLNMADSMWVTAVPDAAKITSLGGQGSAPRTFELGNINGSSSVSGNKIPILRSDGLIEMADIDADGDRSSNQEELVDLGDARVRVTGDIALLKRYKSAGKSATALFRQQDPTKVWAEQQYYRLPPEAQNAGLIPMNRFWRDYAVWDGKGEFISPNLADAAGSFSEMVCALAVLNLPFPGDYKTGKAEAKEGVLTLTPASRQLLFHQDILPAEADNAGTKLLVSQNFYREGDRYIEQAGEKIDKFVSAEFLTGVVYGCQVVVTNPTSSTQRVDVLFQIPAGALPVKATRRVQSLPAGIEAYHTQTLDFYFYFPEAGKFPHFPVHVSRDAKTAASAAPFTFNVVDKPTINDPASWEYVSQHGTNNEVMSFLEQHNVYFLDLEQILWRLKDADFFRRVIAHLESRHIYDEGVWSYAALHNVQPYLAEFLQDSALVQECGPAFESALLKVNPVEQESYQHLEYSPLVNARAHTLGGEHRILNDKFHAQWASLMEVLAYHSAVSAEDWLAVAAYLAAQDRIGEAVEAFAKVNRAAVAEKLQYEYLRAWLAMCQDDTATARRIATALTSNGNGNGNGNGEGKKQGRHLPDHWRDKFAALTSQLDELDGKPAAAPGPEDRDAVQNVLADREPGMELSVEGKVVKVQYRNVSEITVKYYPVDLEFLFSANPFLTTSAARFGNVRPAASEKHMLPANGDFLNVGLPAQFHSRAVLVEITGGGTTKSIPVYAHTLEVETNTAFGQLTVQHAGKPLAKAYVKVFADVNGVPAFYKDGYTDLRGKFDYASLSTDDLNGARRFSILVASEDHGALVQEVKPPAR